MQNYGIFCQFRSKLAITHTIAIRWKEKFDAVVVDCYQTLHLCGDRMKIYIFLGRLPLLPGPHLGQKFQPL